MPPKKAPTKYFKKKASIVKKNNNRKYGSDRKYTNKVNEVGAPSQLFVKLEYVETIGMDTTLNSYKGQIYQSSLFDPNLSGGGHQPRYFDQWSKIFGQYQVLAMKADLEFIQISGNTPVVCGVAWVETNGGFSAVDDLVETKYAKRQVIDGPGAKTVARISTYMTSKRMHGNKTNMNQDDEQALISANPADMFFLHIGTQAADGATSTLVRLRVRLTYYCRFFDQRDPGPS